MTYAKMRTWLLEELQDIRQSGLFKDELVMTTPQGSHVVTTDGPSINFCANNYLGLANHPELTEAVAAGIEN